MNNKFESTQDYDLDMCGIQRSYSQTKLPSNKNHNKDKLKNEFVDKQLLQRKDQEDLGGSIQLNDLNILGLKDYYSGACENNQEIKSKKIEETNDCIEIEKQQNEPFNNTLDQLGQKLNEVIGQYLCELTSQSRLSLDSFSLQNSENLDEEQQQQILDLELNVIRQRIYKQIVDKINLSVIQSVQSIGTSSQLISQNHSNQISTHVSKELMNISATQFSQISQKSPPKSLTHSLLDLQSQLYQSTQQAQARSNKKVDDLPFNIVDCEGTKEELQNKLKISIQLNYQQSQINAQLREELSKYEVWRLTSLKIQFMKTNYILYNKKSLIQDWKTLNQKNVNRINYAKNVKTILSSQKLYSFQFLFQSEQFFSKIYCTLYILLFKIQRINVVQKNYYQINNLNLTTQYMTF